MNNKQTVLLVTDFSYPAKGRVYYQEDVNLSIFLRQHFNVAISHIDDINPFKMAADIILLRNTGPQSTHKPQLQNLRKQKDLRLFNDLLGKGDLEGKGHLLELYKSGYEVIPTFNSKQEAIPSEKYLLKPLDGADSVDVKVVSRKELENESSEGFVIQPLIPFCYEVSFYFINQDFYYALYAPDPLKRWNLKQYETTDEDIEFAKRFISWNACKKGIQRVDACRLKDGRLLLMELEDYNPFLSLEVLDDRTRKDFLEGLVVCLKNSIN